MFDVRSYIETITKPNPSRREINDSRSKKISRLLELRYLYIYRNVKLTETHILPDLNNGKIPETRMTPVGFTYVSSDDNSLTDVNDCRLPIEDYYARFSRADYLDLISNPFFKPDNPMTNSWLLSCAEVIGLQSNEEWAHEILRRTEYFIPSLNSPENHAAYLFLENPWKVFQENDRKAVVIRSFSEEPNSEYMWMNYAGGMTGGEGEGVCIAYDVSQFLQPLCNGVSYLNYLQPVLYSDCTDDRLIPELRVARNEKLTDVQHLRQLTKSCLVKGTTYQQECEWRFVYAPSYRSTPELFSGGVLQEIEEVDNKDFLPFIPSRITLGPNRDDDFAESVKNAVQMFNEKTRTGHSIAIDDSRHSS